MSEQARKVLDSHPLLPPGTQLNERGALATRELDDGRVIDLWPEIMGTVKLSISRTSETEAGDDEWQYQSAIVAAVALLTWDGQGEPEGWYRHYHSGRRRPDGDPAKEYVKL